MVLEVKGWDGIGPGDCGYILPWLRVTQLPRYHRFEDADLVIPLTNSTSSTAHLPLLLFSLHACTDSRRTTFIPFGL